MKGGGGGGLVLLEYMRHDWRTRSLPDRELGHIKVLTSIDKERLVLELWKFSRNIFPMSSPAFFRQPLFHSNFSSIRIFLQRKIHSVASCPTFN